MEEPPSIWDMAPQGKIKNGDTCHVAYDHYHRYKEDVALMKEMGLKSYRFSVSWSRVMPEKGKVNPKGLQFYVDLVKELKTAGIAKKKLSKKDLEIISQPIDFVGVNVYQPNNYMIPGNKPPADAKRTSLGWLVDGRCLYWTIRHYYERYHLPVMVTENGMAASDAICEDGVVHDTDRQEFLQDFLGNVKRAVEEGIPVLGYQHWSIMDNFEWCEGYEPRFGLIHVDYQTQKRTIKDSGHAYAEIIRNNGENL